MKVGIIGCGNMGTAIGLGLYKANVELYLFSPGQEKAKDLALKTKGVHVTTLENMPSDLDWYVLAFKPQQLVDFDFKFKSEAKILSVLAGVSIDTLKNKFGINNVARLMPNTPSKIGAGANLFFADFSSEDLINNLQVLGKVYNLNSEDELDKLTAFSGSGPALIFEFARLFASNIMQISPDSKDANQLVVDTFLGSSILMNEELKNNISFETLRDQVTSKKGVTFEALEVLAKNDFERIMNTAFTNAYKRVLELKSQQ